MKRSAALRLSLALFIFGTIGIFRHYIPLSSTLIAFVRGTVGTLFLLLVMLLQKKRPDRAALREHFLLLLLSGAAIGFNWILLFEAYRFTSVAVATLCYYMAPIFLILLSVPLLKEKLTGRSICCCVLALAGMVMVSGVLSGQMPTAGETKGILFGLAAAALYAVVMLINKKITGLPAFERTVSQLGFASLVLLPYLLLTEKTAVSIPENQLTLPVLLLLLAVGILHTGIAYWLYFGAMEHLPARTIGILSYIDPVVAILLSALFLAEPLGLWGGIGSVLIIGAALLSELRKE